jgi:hypothetical protein
MTRSCTCCRPRHEACSAAGDRPVQRKKAVAPRRFVSAAGLPAAAHGRIRTAGRNPSTPLPDRPVRRSSGSASAQPTAGRPESARDQVSAASPAAHAGCSRAARASASRARPGPSWRAAPRRSEPAPSRRRTAESGSWVSGPVPELLGASHLRQPLGLLAAGRRLVQVGQFLPELDFPAVFEPYADAHLGDPAIGGGEIALRHHSLEGCSLFEELLTLGLGQRLLLVVMMKQCGLSSTARTSVNRATLPGMRKGGHVCAFRLASGDQPARSASERSLSCISHAWSSVWYAECRMRNGSVQDRIRRWTSPAL